MDYLDGLKAERASIDAEIATLNEQRRPHDAAMRETDAEMQAAMQRAGGDIPESTRQRRLAAGAALRDLDSQMGPLKRQHDGLKQRIAEEERGQHERAWREADPAALAERCSSLALQRESFGERLSHLNAERRALEDKADQARMQLCSVNELRNEIATLEQRLTAARAEAFVGGSSNDEIGSLSKGITQKQRGLAAAEETAANASAFLATVTCRLDGLKEQTAQIQADRERIGRELTRVRAHLWCVEWRPLADDVQSRLHTLRQIDPQAASQAAAALRRGFAVPTFEGGWAQPEWLRVL